MQSMLPYALRPELRIDPDAILLLWHQLFFSLVNVLLPFPWLRNRQFRHRSAYIWFMKIFRPTFRKRIMGFVENLSSQRSIIFPDRRTIDRTASFLGCNFQNPEQISIPVEIYQRAGTRVAVLQEAGPLRVCWIGRLYDFKIHILNHTIERLSQHANATKTRMHFILVGEGPEARRLTAPNPDDRCFSLERIPYIANESLPEFLLANVDVVAAMGTSALEGARVGLPTIMLDYSFSPLRGRYRYRWLHEVSGDDLGHAISNGDLHADDSSLEGMIDMLPRSFSDIARKCLTYCREHHGIDNIASRFISMARSASFRWRDVPRSLSRKGTLRRLYEGRRYGPKKVTRMGSDRSP
jgi:hypothetical protein